MARSEEDLDLKAVADTLNAIINQSITAKGLTYSTDPELTQRDIIEYQSRMRISAMEKFNAPCFVSVVNFYLSEKHKEGHDSSGAVVVYVERANADKLLKVLGYPVKLDSTEDQILELTGELCKRYAGELAKQVDSGKYGQLILSEPKNHFCNILDGIEFKYEEYYRYEMCYYLWKEKILAADVTLAKK